MFKVKEKTHNLFVENKFSDPAAVEYWWSVISDWYRMSH